MKLIRIAWFLILLLIAVMPRVPASGLLNTGIFNNYLWTDLALFLLAILLILRGLSPNNDWLFDLKGSTKTNIKLGFIILIAVQYVSLLISIFRMDLISLSYLWTGYVWARALVIILVARIIVREQNFSRRFLRWFLAGYAIVCIIGILELLEVQIVVDFLNVTYGTEQHLAAALTRISQGSYRITSTLDRNPHGLALYTMIGTTIIISIFLIVKNIRFSVSLALIVLLGLGLLNLFVTNSRLGLLAMSVSLVTVTISQPISRLRRKLILASLVMITTIVFQSLFQTSITRYGTLFHGLQTGDYSVSGIANVTERLAAWSVVVSLVSRRLEWLLFGVGPSQLNRLVRLFEVFTDSDYISILLTIGVIGLIFYILLLAIMLRGVFNAHDRVLEQSTYTHALLLAAKGVLVGFIVAGLAGPFMTSSAFDRNSYLLFTLVGIALYTR